jgi:hypothetical protein
MPTYRPGSRRLNRERSGAGLMSTHHLRRCNSRAGSMVQYSDAPLLRFTTTCSSSLFFTVKRSGDLFLGKGSCKRRSLPELGRLLGFGRLTPTIRLTEFFASRVSHSRQRELAGPGRRSAGEQRAWGGEFMMRPSWRSVWFPGFAHLSRNFQRRRLLPRSADVTGTHLVFESRGLPARESRSS